MRWLGAIALICLAVAGLIAACSGPPRPLPLTPGPDTCGAAAWQHLIGQPRTAADALPQPKRVYHITDAITQDFREDRINVVLDDSGTIGAVTCG